MLIAYKGQTVEDNLHIFIYIYSALGLFERDDIKAIPISAKQERFGGSFQINPGSSGLRRWDGANPVTNGSIIKV